MDINKIKHATELALMDTKTTELSDEELGLDSLERIAKLGNQSLEIIGEALPESLPELEIAALGGLGLGGFGAKIKGLIEGVVKTTLCRAEKRIDTPEERKKIAEEYGPKIADLVTTVFPQVSVGKSLIALVVRYLLAQGLALAANSLDDYCAVS